MFPQINADRMNELLLREGNSFEMQQPVVIPYELLVSVFAQENRTIAEKVLSSLNSAMKDISSIAPLVE